MQILELCQLITLLQPAYHVHCTSDLAAVLRTLLTISLLLIFILCCDSLTGFAFLGTRTIVHPKARIIAEAGPIIIGEGNLIEERCEIINRYVLLSHTHTVLRECCNDYDTSQWESIPSPLRKPLNQSSPKLTHMITSQILWLPS